MYKDYLGSMCRVCTGLPPLAIGWGVDLLGSAIFSLGLRA